MNRPVKIPAGILKNQLYILRQFKNRMKMKPIQNMTQTKQIKILKKELSAVNMKITRLTKSYEKLMKVLEKLEKYYESTKAKKRVSYIDWLENERRMKDLF